MLSWFDPVQVFRLATFVQADVDPPAGCVDGVYLCGSTPDNEGSILAQGLELYDCDKVGTILIGEGGQGGTPYFPPNAAADAPMAYSGSKAWREHLTARGVYPQDICEHPCPWLSHTGTDAQAFIQHARDKGWQTAYVVAWPVHLPRVFVLCVTWLLRKYPELKLYAKAGTPLPWLEKVAASQGDVWGNRLEGLMQAEFDRLTRVYGNEHDPVSPEKFFAYIRWRDGGS